MSTIDDCRKSGLLFGVSGNLRPHQNPQRILMAEPRTKGWMQTVLPALQSDGHVAEAISPKAQLGVLFNRFVSGEDFEPPLPHEMRPYDNGIWELRTHDLRLIGWFPMRAVFILSAIETKVKCMNLQLYDGLKSQASHDRDRIGLFGGAYITGKLNDVL